MSECPIETVYPEVNLSNHMIAIKLANLGPADPREPSTAYWQAKQELWNVTEGVARTRLCMNCAHYNNSEEALQCIATGPGGQVKPSELPVQPAWADIAGMPAALCTQWHVTCSALRTCDTWESVEDEEESDDVDTTSASPQPYMLEKATETYKPTTGMASAARRALDWKKEGYAGGTRVGLTRANQLVRRENLTASTVLRMHSFFSRHEVDKQATGFSSGEEGFPSAGRVAWDLWGGDGGQAWARSKRDQIMRDRENT